MSQDGFTLYSPAHISREEYMGWLHQLNAVMIPEEGGAFDARLSKDVRHVWTYLLDEEELDMDMREREEEPEVLAKLRQLLGGEPRSAIVLVANNAEGSKILAVEFAALCAEHYSCVVEQAAGHALFPAQKLLKYRDAGMGFDGSTWETADPIRSFSWEDLEVREETEGPLNDYMSA
jgi:hypothetical protein